MPTVLKILLHIGDIMSTLNAVEATINDLTQKKSTGADVTALINDISALFSDGIIPLPPGLTLAQVQAALGSLATMNI